MSNNTEFFSDTLNPLIENTKITKDNQKPSLESWVKRLINFTIIFVIFSLSTFCVYLLLLNTYYVNLHKKAPGKMEFISDCSSNSIYKIQAQNLTRKYFDKLNSENWTFFKKFKDGDKSYILPTEDDLNTYKMNGTITGPEDKIVEIIFKNLTNLHEWEENIKEASVLKEIDESTRIIHTISNSIGPIASRESVMFSYYGKLENDRGFYIVYESVEWDFEGRNETENEFVRNFAAPMGWLFTRKDGEKNLFDFQYLVDVNPRMVWIPFKDSVFVRTLRNGVEAFKTRLSTYI